MVIAKSALESNALCVEAAVDYLLQLKSLGVLFFFMPINAYFPTHALESKLALIKLNFSYPRDAAAHVGTQRHRQPYTWGGGRLGGRKADIEEGCGNAAG